MNRIKIFISFRETERDYREAFEGILQNPNNPLQGIPISSREDVRTHGQNFVKNHIKQLIDNCDVLICLIGNDSHNSPWVDYEIAVATSKQIPIIGVRIPETSGSGPNLFVKREISICEWNTDQIAEEIEEIFD
jgi:hypothetical protein